MAAPYPFSVEYYLEVDGKSSMYCTTKGPVHNGRQGAAGVHLGPMLISQCQTSVLLPHFPVSLQGQEIHAYLESIEADYTLSLGNIVVSEDLLSLL